MTAEGESPASTSDNGAASVETDETEAADAEGYVHDPGRSRRPHQAPPDDDFDWRGWVLVVFVVVAFMVVPTAILFLPQAEEFIASLGLTLRDAYLVLPLVPAFILGAAAVWAAVRSRSQ